MAPPPPEPSCRLGLALLVGLTLASGGCIDDRPGVPRVSRDPNVQVRFELATKMLAEIEQRSLAGAEIYGNCKMARALFFRELRRSSAKPAQALVRRLTKLCTGAARKAKRKAGDHR